MIRTKIYLDTNILLDLLIKERTSSMYSLKVFSEIKEKRFEAVLSTQSIIDSYYTAYKNGLAKEEIDLVVEWMMNHINVRPIGYFDMLIAMKSDEKDLEDAAQIALAKREYCDIFLTSDNDILQRERDEFLIFMSPGELIEKATE